MSTKPLNPSPHALTVIRPDVPKGTHPVTTGKYVLATTPINEFLSKLDNWIEFRMLGATVYGNPRLGKTHAITYAKNYVKEEYPSLPVFTHLCKTHKTPSGDAFYTELLQSVGHKYQKGKIPEKRDRIIKFLMASASAKGANRILLFMDDAQLLTELHYKWLMDIQNELAKENIILTTILVGQEELIHYRATLSDANQGQIVGRFMTTQHRFRGLETITDIKECLKRYDEDTEYPRNSGYSFTQYFFPEAYTSHRFRLQNSAKNLVTAVQKLHSQRGMRKKFELPMQFMTSATEYCLKRFGVDGMNVDELTVKHWMEALVNVGYLDFVDNHLLSLTNWKNKNK